MPSDPSRGRSWRQETGGTERKREAQPQWRREPTTPSAPAPRISRKSKIAATAFGFIVFCGLLVWAIMLLIPPKAACLVPIYAGYEDNLAVPPNIYGRNSIQGLVKLTESGSGSFFWGSGLLHLKTNLTEYRTTDESWDKDLSKINEKTVVVYMALHGGSDREGAYLLPADSNGRSADKNRLRMEQVLDRLSKIDNSKNKVLILDATQISADWPLGILDNGFARELNKLESKIAGIPNLVVLSASDEDQRSWVSEEWRQTVFGHFVIEGLKGEAGESRGGRINALNLYNYVQKKVTNWVRSNRNALQQPVLLPAGQLGKDRAGNMDLVVVKDAYQAPNPKEIREFQPPEELLNAWKAFHEMDKEVPSPAVYSPNLWRQYQEYLLRYELMIRVDDKGTSTLLEKLKDLGSQISQARSEKLNSAQNAIPMPAAAGLGRLQPDLLMKQFNDLWDANPDDWARKWDSILKTAKNNSNSEKQLLRVQIGELLIRQVAKDPANDLDKGAKLARVLEDKVSPRPAELHFLIMLNRDRVENPKPAGEYYTAIKTALELRLFAEKTAFNLAPDGHLYSERIYPWIKSPVELADDSRRIGQDLLFASNPLSWSVAMKSFKVAEDEYLEARAIGLAVRAGFAARDQAYEVLPALSKWAALRRPSDQAQRQTDDAELLRSIKDLWREVHRLDRQLEKPNAALVKEPPKADLDDPKPLNIVDRTKSINSGLGKLRSQFDAICQKLADSGADLQTEWHDTEGALTVPFMDPTLRMRLITSSRRTSLHLLTESSGKSTEGETAGEDERKKSRKAAVRQGRMALVGLGKNWFDLCKSPTGELDKFSSVMMRMDTPLDDSNWTKSIATGGDQIGIRWQQMPNEIKTRVDVAAKSELEQAQGSLEYADELARLMDPGSKTLAAHDVVEEYRRLLFLNFLHWQAQRTYDDHWFDLAPELPPYYQWTGKMLLEDAAKLVPQADRLQTLNDIRKKLNQKGQLEAEGPPRLNITSERTFGVCYRIRPPKEETMPHGFPVVGVKVGKELEFVNPGEAERAVHELTGNDQPLAPISVTIRSPLLEKAEANPPTRPEPVSTNISIDGLYRGQRIPGGTLVNLYPLPEIAQVQPQKPEHGSLAVRADPALFQQFAPNRGALAIVMDCSGSMWFPHEAPDPLPPGAKVPGDSRFVKAVDSLEKVLQEIPEGTKVGLWVFGQKRKDGEIDLLRPISSWKRDQLDRLMKDVRNQMPYYGTPLVKSLRDCKKALEDAAIEGFKSIVVLTDGRDEEFRETGGLDGITDIPTYLAKKIMKPDLLINIVSFEATPKDVQIAKDDFSIIEDPKWPTPGKLFFVKKDPKELIVKLRRALRQSLRYWVENPDGTLPLGLNDSLEVSASGSNDQWVPDGLLKPGGYNVRVQTTNRNVQNIYLQRGDLLLMRLKKDLNFERLIFSKEDYPGKVAVEKEGWRMAVLQNQKDGDRKLQMLTTLERITDRIQTTIQQVKPTDVWFELQPAANVKDLFGFRWGYQYGYPAATWGFDVPEWPLALGSSNLASPRVQAWWFPDQEAPSSAVLQQGADFSAGRELFNRPIQVDGDKAVVESVSVENHLVEVVRGQKPTMQPCLVVRIACPKNKPIWVKVSGGWNIEGFEHRFYQDADKYTGLFWPVPENAAETLTKLSVISVEAFKREAKQRGFNLELEDAKVPESGDYRPPAKLLLK